MAANYLFAGDTVETDNTFPYSGISSDAKLSMKKAVSSQSDINSSPDGAAVFDEESIDDIVNQAQMKTTAVTRHSQVQLKE